MKRKLVVIMMGVMLLGTGMSVQAKQEELTKQYQYDIGSTSKMFGAAAVMKLVDDGKIDLDTPLYTYLPEFSMADERYREITPRMLLNHSSGLQGCHYDDMILYNDIDTTAKEKLLSRLKTQVLKTKPGEHAVYSNDGFTLVEFLVEKVSGMSFTEYLEKNFCAPLGMTQTRTIESTKKPGIRARNYDKQMKELPFEECSVISSGGVQSSSDDLCRFGTLFLKDGSNILSEKSKEAFRQEENGQLKYFNPCSIGESGFGLGWDQTNLERFREYGLQAMTKGGDVGCQHANLTVIPDKNMAAATVLSGGSSEFGQLVSSAILEAALEVTGEEKKDNITTIDALDAEYQGMKAEKIEPEYLKFAGDYGWSTYYKVSFPDETTLQIDATQKDRKICQKFKYAGNGAFVGNSGITFSEGDFETAGDGKNGISKLFLRKEKDGCRYIYSDTHTAYAGFEMNEMTTTCGKQLNPVKPDKATLAAWEKRNDQYYYLVSEKYSSTNWKKDAFVHMKLGALEGYVDQDSIMNSLQIVDADHGVPFAPFRDTTTAEFTRKDGVEYMSLKDVGFVFADASILNPFMEHNGTCSIGQNEGAKWYQVTDEEGGKQVEIETTGHASAYVYDKYHEVMFTTNFLNGDHTVILPAGGTVCFIGEQGSQMSVTYK